MTTIEQQIGFFEGMLEYSEPPLQLINDKVHSYAAIELTKENGQKVVGKNLRIERVFGLVMMDGIDANHGRMNLSPIC